MPSRTPGSERRGRRLESSHPDHLRSDPSPCLHSGRGQPCKQTGKQPANKAAEKFHNIHRNNKKCAYNQRLAQHQKRQLKRQKMYDSPHQFEPTSLSDRQLEGLQPLTESIVHSSIKLTSAAHETTRATLRELVRQMNSFYTATGVSAAGAPTCAPAAALASRTVAATVTNTPASARMITAPTP